MSFSFTIFLDGELSTERYRGDACGLGIACRRHWPDIEAITEVIIHSRTWRCSECATYSVAGMLFTFDADVFPCSLEDSQESSSRCIVTNHRYCLSIENPRPFRFSPPLRLSYLFPHCIVSSVP